LIVINHQQALPTGTPDQTNVASSDWQTTPEIAPVQAASRPVFPFSIVPGGVRNSSELQAAASADRVVADHYSDFRISRAHAIRLNQPQMMYVSYRRNNRVFWTKNRMLIPAGETLLSDGENLARVRCANRLSPIAVKPVAAAEPTTEELTEPNFVPPLLATLLPGEHVGFFPGGPAGTPGLPVGASAPPSTPGSPSEPVLPPILLPGGPSITPNTPVTPPPVSTPEPGTLQLLAISSMLALLMVFFRRKS
jgi:hypothetical protein